jgi:ATP-binding cassette subfamily B protein
VVPTVITGRRVNSRIYGFYQEATPEVRERRYLQGLLHEPKLAKEIRAFGLGPHFLERHGLLDWNRHLRQARLYRTADRTALLSGAVSGAALVGAYAFVVARGLSGDLTAGDLAALLAAMTAVNQQASLLATTLALLDQHARFLTDYFEFLAIAPLVPAPAQPVRLPRGLEPGLEVDAVTFTYPRGTEPALAGVSLRVAPGELLALVGDNGAGKTTLVKLLLRLYDPQEGSVRLGGVDLREMEGADLRRRVGVLFQDYAQYELTVRENVTLGRVERPVSDRAVAAALERAAADTVVADFPGGLDARVGRLFDGGHDLSGGEWQRLALARLVYRDADIWILDEPTAALDPEAEAAVFADLRRQLTGRMGIVISHRFSTVRVADRIAVLAGGRVIEEGTHDELVALGGRYRRLFDLQAAGYR